MFHRHAVTGCVTALTLVACGGDDGAPGTDWSGTVTDSAGIQIVVNSVTPLWGTDGAWFAEDGHAREVSTLHLTDHETVSWFGNHGPGRGKPIKGHPLCGDAKPRPHYRALALPRKHQADRGLAARAVRCRPGGTPVRQDTRRAVETGQKPAGAI